MLTVPARHRVHSLLPGWLAAAPAPHARQVLEALAPLTTLAVPGGHSRQGAPPLPKLPGGQGLHCVTSVAPGEGVL